MTFTRGFEGQMGEAKKEQSNTKILKARDLVQRKIELENLPEPYIFVEDNDIDQLAQTVNILAIKKQ